MFPAYIDPIAPGLVPAFAAALHVEFLGIAAAALVGILTVVCLVALDAARARRQQPQRSAATCPPPKLRRAA